ncbi:MAG: Rne/Rng family ribonuclease, partial [Giesbergeria sp.]
AGADNLLDIDLTGSSAAAAEPAADEPPRRSYFAAAPQVAPVPDAAPAPAQAPVVVSEAAPTVAAAPAVVAVVAAPAAPHHAGLPRVAPYQLPVQEMQQVAEGSGLQWVQSDADKVAAVQAAIAAEPRPIHVPRERPPVVVLDEGPLVLVETRRDLRDLQLPFEQEQRPAA